MEEAEDMYINPQRAAQLFENIGRIRARINAANKTGKEVRLIAVSKLKPPADILALHQPRNTSEPPQFHFGENYVQELIDKADRLPKSIQWHMIGGLQSNKCKQLAQSIPNLYCVSSVDSAKKADQLEKGRKIMLQGDYSVTGPGPQLLKVMVQVNTSGEESKSGVAPKDALKLCQHILKECLHLELAGFMTIGAIARSQETTPENENEDFLVLRETRDQVAKELGMDPDMLKLSMGMSADFEGAIAMGSDEVRVGSEIFGARPPKEELKAQKDSSTNSKD